MRTVLFSQLSYFKNSKAYSFGKNYDKENFLLQNPPKTETDVVDSVIEQFSQNGHKLNNFNIFYSIGRIFEKRGLYDKASAFYIKAEQSLPASRVREKQDINFDLQRVADKKYTQKNNEWNA